jgi:outer membrane receptor protein involved in Fe transport
MSNLIVAEPGEIEYSYTGDPVRTDTIPALINANVDEALLYGFDMSFSYNIYKNWVLFGSSAFVRGVNTNTDEDLPLIPPLNGRTGLRYKTNSGYGFELIARLVADQEKIAEGETPTPGYASYDLRLFTPAINLAFARLNFYAGIENITDRAYINHLSTNRGIIKYEPGRNFYLRLGVAF